MADDLFEQRKSDFNNDYVAKKMKSRATPVTRFKDNTRVLSQKAVRQMLNEAFEKGYYQAKQGR